MGKNERPAQTREILAYMRENGSITPLEALNELGCMRLGSRIFELRSQGFNIATEKVAHVNKAGKKSVFAKYVLKEGA